MPAAYLPYAGFFKERAQRDAYVAEHNIKNSVGSFQEICANLGTVLLDPTETPLLTFSGGQLTTSAIEGEVMELMDPEAVIAAESPILLDATKVREYFAGSDYLKPLDLLVLPTDDNFGPTGRNIAVHFHSDGSPVVSDVLERRTGVNYLEIRVRETELARVIAQGLPWEDLSIGFQCRIYREPNVYNSDFWYHFTNVYVNDRVKTRIMNCAGCEVVAQAVY